MTKVMEKIAQIDSELKLGNNRTTNRHQSYALNVLEDSLVMLKKDHYYHELQASIVKEKKADIIKIK